MSRSSGRKAWAALAGWILISGALSAQAPVTGERIDFRDTHSDLATEVARLGSGWLGYAVPSVDRRGSICCWSAHERRVGCSLERRGYGVTLGHEDSRSRRLRALDTTLQVFLETDGGEVADVRSFSTDCPVDAHDMRLVMLAGVDVEDSAQLLERLAGASDRHVAEHALAALALHASATADRVLAQRARAGNRDLREEAIFWLGEARGDSGLEILRDLVRSTEEEMREEITFALSISQAEGAFDELERLARHDRSPEVRGQGLFWLAQSGDDRAVAAIRDAVHDDPSHDVREEAVFALSQLPDHRGVPELFALLRTSKDREIQKEAMFWLAQSGDPQVLDWFDRVLNSSPR